MVVQGVNEDWGSGVWIMDEKGGHNTYQRPFFLLLTESNRDICDGW